MSKKPKKTHKVGGLHETTIVFTPKQSLLDLAEVRRNGKKRQQSIAGTVGKAVGEAVENKHLDRTAFGIATKLEAMDDERLHVTYHALLKYMDDLGVTKRATAQEELFAAGETSEPSGKFSSEGDGDGEGDGNVATFKPRSARGAGESAGAAE